MDSLTALFPPESISSQPDAAQHSLLDTRPGPDQITFKQPGEILLQHIDNLRCDKLKAYVEGDSDIDQLITEYVFQVNSAIDLYRAMIDHSAIGSGEKNNLKMAQKRAENGLQWLEDLR